MKAQNVLAGIDYVVTNGDVEKEIYGIEYDSRKAKEGVLFVCIEGMRADGHDFAMEAYERGCRAFLTERRLKLPNDAFQAVTENTREALAYISAAYYGYPGNKLTLIGVTGTKGKTTTSVLIQSILNSAGHRCGYIGSIGVRYGKYSYELNCTTPESLELQRYLAAMASDGIKYVVIEVSSQALNYYRVAGLNFETCVFTNLSPDHIGPNEHLSFEDYRDTKKKLFTDYGCKNIIYNKDDHVAPYMVEDAKCNTISFSEKEGDADYRVKDLEIKNSEGYLGISFSCITSKSEVIVEMMIPGIFNALNGVAAMAVAKCYGVSVVRSAEVLKETKVEGRFEVIDGPDGSVLVVDYAHNAVSFKNALYTLRQYELNRIICVFGCVGERSKERRKELGIIASAMGDYSIFTSQNPYYEPPRKICEDILTYYDKSKPFEIVVDRNEAVKRAIEIAGQGDIVFFAGKGHEKYQMVNGVTIPYDEKKAIFEAKKIIEKRKHKFLHRF